YGFTDYRAQGQTINYVIVDIGSPPSGKLSLTALYAALSRSSGQDDQLEGLNRVTKQWWAKIKDDGDRRGG
ncbi:hypothetical protein K435DRAFT_698454, partial [Dendrothele bispora CBS 962.96]